MSEKTSVIEISDVGPIVYREFDLLDEGGVVVLRGRNAAGKSTCLTAMRVGCGGADPDKLTIREGAASGHVTVAGRTVRLAKRSKSKASPAGVDHIEDKYDFLKIVDPGIEDKERADAARIRELVRVAEVEVQPSTFIPAGFTMGEDGYLRPAEGVDYPFVNFNKAMAAQDAIDMYREAKAAYQAAALSAEKTAKASEGEFASNDEAAKMAAPGVANLNAVECDSEKLGAALAEALAQRAVITEKAAAFTKALASQAEAKERLRVVREKGGISAEEAEQRYKDASGERDKQAAEVLRLERELSIAKSKVDAAEIRQKSALSAWEAAKSQQETIKQLEAVLNSLPAKPSDDDIAGAADAVEEAKRAVALGSAVVTARKHRDIANNAKARAKAFSEYAKRLRAAADECDSKLEGLISFGGFSVKGGRLLYTEDGRTRQFSTLSDGEKYKAAFAVGALRVGSIDGEAPRLLILNQTGWQDLDTKARKLVWSLAKQYKITVYAAAVDDGELRCEEWVPPATAI